MLSSWLRRSVAGIGVGHEVEFDIGDGADESVEALLRVVEKGVTRNHQFPLCIPDRATDEPVIGILGSQQCSTLTVQAGTEVRRTRHWPKRLLFSGGEEGFREGIAGLIKFQ